MCIVNCIFAESIAELRLPYSKDNGNANPNVANDMGYPLKYFIFQPLWNYGTNKELVMRLASDCQYEKKDDKVILKIVLRKNVFWHDGHPFSADDIIFTFDKIKESQMAQNKINLKVNNQYFSWTKVNDYEISITLSDFYGPIFFQLSEIMILPKHCFNDKIEFSQHPFMHHPIGTGPYKIEKWEQAAKIVLVPHTLFYEAVPKQKVVLRYFPDEESAMIALENGEIDIKWLAPEHQKRAKEAGLNVLKYVYPFPITLATNWRNLPSIFGKKFGQLNAEEQKKNLADFLIYIESCIDKNQVAKIVTKELGEASYYIFAEEGSLDGYINKKNLPRKFNPKGKKYVLQRALKLITYAGFPEYKLAAEIIQENLRKVGIELEIIEIPEEQFFGYILNPENANSWDFLLEEFPHAYWFDPDLYNELSNKAFPPEGKNVGYYDNPKVEELLNQARKEMDLAKRKELMYQVQDELYAFPDAIRLYTVKDAFGINKNVTGYPLDCSIIRQFIRVFSHKLIKK